VITPDPSKRGRGGGGKGGKGSGGKGMEKGGKGGGIVQLKIFPENPNKAVLRCRCKFVISKYLTILSLTN